MSIWSILRPFGIFYGNSVDFFPFRYVVPRKINPTHFSVVDVAVLHVGNVHSRNVPVVTENPEVGITLNGKKSGPVNARTVGKPSTTGSSKIMETFFSNSFSLHCWQDWLHFSGM
jgi:hypothetical protein